MKKTSYHLVLWDRACRLVIAEPFGPPGAGGCEGPALTLVLISFITCHFEHAQLYVIFLFYL